MWVRKEKFVRLDINSTYYFITDYWGSVGSNKAHLYVVYKKKRPSVRSVV